MKILFAGAATHALPDRVRCRVAQIALARSVASFCDLGRKTFANPLALPTPHV